MLGAVLFAAAAAHALGRKGRFPPQRHHLPVFPAAGLFVLGVHLVVAAERPRNVHPLGAGHTVPAAGAGGLHPPGDRLLHLFQQREVLPGHLPGAGAVGDAAVFLHHLQAVHAGQHAGHLQLVPQPAQRPLGGGPGAGAAGEQPAGLLGQQVHQLAAPQRLHDDHRQPPGRGRLQPGPAGLAVLVHIVVLDLAEIPVIAVQQPGEHPGPAMEGESHLPDLPGSLLVGQPPAHAGGLQLVPALHIGEHVHQVKVHMVGAQPAQLLGEVAFQVAGAPHQVLGQLGGDLHPVPAVVAGQDLPQGGLAARVDVGGVEVVHPGPDGRHHLGFGFVQVDARPLAGKAHTAVSQHRDRLPLSVVAILHGPSSGSCGSLGQWSGVFMIGGFAPGTSRAPRPDAVGVGGGAPVTGVGAAACPGPATARAASSGGRPPTCAAAGCGAAGSP